MSPKGSSRRVQSKSKGNSQNKQLLPDAVIAQRLEFITRPAFSPEYFEKKSLPAAKKKSQVKTIGILTSGGDGPAENAAIEALARIGIEEYGYRVLGISDGFKGLLDPQNRVLEIEVSQIAGDKALHRARQILYRSEWHDGLNGAQGIEKLGGNILRSSRTDPIQKNGDGKEHATLAKKTLHDYGIDALVVLGGNGTQCACLDLHRMGVPLVFLPQSIDADVPGSFTSIGFPSAVNRGALEIVAFLNTAQSCGRWFLVEVMGQRYGMLTLGVGRNARLGHYFEYGHTPGPPVRVDSLFTELPRPMSEIPLLIQRRKGHGQDHGVLLIAEGVIFEDAQPPRETNAYNRMLIEAGDVSRWVRQRLLTRHDLRNTRSVSLGYSLRGTNPSPHDIELAQKLSEAALALVDRGAFGRMVGLEFKNKSPNFSFHYPKISDVAHSGVNLDPQYFEHVKNLLEDSSL